MISFNEMLEIYVAAKKTEQFKQDLEAFKSIINNVLNMNLDDTGKIKEIQNLIRRLEK